MYKCNDNWDALINNSNQLFLLVKTCIYKANPLWICNSFSRLELINLYLVFLICLESCYLLCFWIYEFLGHHIYSDEIFNICFKDKWDVIDRRMFLILNKLQRIAFYATISLYSLGLLLLYLWKNLSLVRLSKSSLEIKVFTSSTYPLSNIYSGSLLLAFV